MSEATDLYELLGLTREATVEEVRKAYKKKALQTHPDRLPQGATAEDKAASEEKFRRVNNAYEILSDPTKRTQYDTFGVWPPPEEEPERSHNWSNRPHHHNPFSERGPYRSQTFPDPFFSSRFQNQFQFTDPFALFDEIFQGTPFTRASRPRHHSTNSRSPMDVFDRFNRMEADIDGFMNNLDHDPFMRGFPSHGFMPSMPSVTRITSSTFGNGNGITQFVSESYTSTNVNGVQQSIRKRIDAEGNEHVTRTFPDGSKVRTINGVEHSQGHVHGQNRLLQDHSGNRYIHHTPTVPPQQVRFPPSLANVSSSTRNGFVPQSSQEPSPPPYASQPSPISPQRYDNSMPLNGRSRYHSHHNQTHLHRHGSLNSSPRSNEKYNYTADPTNMPQRKHSSRWWPPSLGRQ